MRKVYRFVAVLLMVTLITGCGGVLDKYKKDIDIKPEETQKKNWTLMIYLAGDIEKDIAKLLQEEMVDVLKTGSSANVHIVTQIDYPGDKDEAERFYVYKEALAKRGKFEKMNMGDPETLKGFLQWGLSHPADKYALIVMGHGTGWISLSGPGSVLDAGTKSFGYDHTDEDCITLVEFKSVLDQVLNGKKIDVAAFNCCLMNETEVAYQMKDYFNHLVAAETTMPAFGFDYPYFIRKLAAMDMSSEQLAREIYVSAESEYQNMKKLLGVLKEEIKELEYDLSWCWDDWEEEQSIKRELREKRNTADILNRLEYQVGLVNLSAMDNLSQSIKNYTVAFDALYQQNREEAVTIATRARARAKKFGDLFTEVYKQLNLNPVDKYEYVDLSEYMLEVYDNTADTHNSQLAGCARQVIEAAYDVVTESWYSNTAVKYSKISVYLPPERSFYQGRLRGLYNRLDFPADSGWLGYIDTLLAQ